MRQLHVEDVEGIHELYPAHEIESIEVFEKLAGTIPGKPMIHFLSGMPNQINLMLSQVTGYSRLTVNWRLGWSRAITAQCSACRPNQSIDEKGEKRARRRSRIVALNTLSFTF